MNEEVISVYYILILVSPITYPSLTNIYIRYTYMICNTYIYKSMQDKSICQAKFVKISETY